MKNHLTVLKDGQQALNYLFDKHPEAEFVRPDLILLDLNLPGINGLQVLQTIKNDADLQNIPVVVLSASASQKDIEKSYARKASWYVVKPGDFQQLVHIVKNIQEFWFHLARSR